MSIEAMKLALEALDGIHPDNMTTMAEEAWGKAIETLRAAIEQAEEQRPHYTWQYAKDYIASRQAEQEPVAWADKYDIEREGHDFYVNRQQPSKDGAPLYTAPPQREWVGLTDEDMNKLWHLVDWTVPLDIKKFARTIEAKLKEKNNG